MSIKEIIGRSYWGKLFYRDKFLFILIFLFFAFSISANVIKLGTAPFFIWSVYSERIPPQASYSFYEVRYDSRLLNVKHSWDQTRKMLLFDPLSYYIQAGVEKRTDPQRDWLENHWGVRHPRWRSLVPLLYPGPEQFGSFPGWYKKYLSQQVGGPVKEIDVIKRNVRFTENGDVREISSDTALVISGL